MWLQTRMFLLIALLFGILYGVITGIGTWMGAGSAIFYLVLAFAFLGIQYLISPAIVGWTMKIKWVTEKEAPELHRMVSEMAAKANLPKPKVGISQMNIPNAFAFGRTQKDGRVCVTQGLMGLLSREELKSVIGHEIAHIKNRDMAIITLLSAIPLILYWIALRTMWGGSLGDNRQGGNFAVLIGIGAFVLYFLTNLLVLYGSRIREYYADMGSVRLGNPPHHMATALYKLSYSSARQGNQAEEKQVQGLRAFFVNDPARSWYQVKQLSQIDRNKNGTIDFYELQDLRQKSVKLSTGEKMSELFTTHPNMLKRIKHLSSLNG
ncbi:MAG TPA: zinc metalloprotease HtpX [Dehalococcoidales bacterium]|nr:zinc metalloprotease HtpX [Dehalococcoidales bacterium]